jgi:hypothetical protein
MSNFTRNVVIAASLVTSLSVAAAAQAAPASNVYGEAVPASTPDRSVTLTAQTKSVNVDDGQTVRFDANGKSFVWHFDTLSDTPNFDLSAIAPKDIDVKGVRVYVNANPLYRN